MLVVGPACVLTHATAALSFIALQLSESDLIRTFGEAGLVATLIAMFAVLMLVPLLGILLVRNESVFVVEVRGADSAVNVLRRFCAWIAGRMVATPASTACSALCHHPAAASLPGVQMASALHIVCPHCDAINRVPRARLRDGAKCGSCQRPLYEGWPAALDSVARFDKHAKHSGVMPLAQLLA